MEPESQPAGGKKKSTVRSLVLSGARNFVFGVVALGALLLLGAGTLDYWQAWVFAPLFIALVTQQGIYLAIKDPHLLERRKKIAQAGESLQQRVFIIVGLLANLGLIAISALSRRFGWSHMSPVFSLAGDALVVLSYFVYYLVFKENTFAASSIQTFEGQKVVSTGPYALLRHPKYAGDLLMIAGIALALGSWWGLAFLIPAVLALAWRTLDEEKLLKKDLPGYVEYTRKVRYRLVPYLW